MDSKKFLCNASKSDGNLYENSAPFWHVFSFLPLFRWPVGGSLDFLPPVHWHCLLLVDKFFKKRKEVVVSPHIRTVCYHLLFLYVVSVRLIWFRGKVNISSILVTLCAQKKPTGDNSPKDNGCNPVGITVVTSLKLIIMWGVFFKEIFLNSVSTSGSLWCCSTMANNVKINTRMNVENNVICKYVLINDGCNV